jgi:glycosyltransferase involved in cell wall biosynthesis
LIIVPSRTLEQALTPKFHSPVEQIALGIDAVRFRPLSVSMPERPELQILGRLDPVKGHEQFFEIFKLFLSSWGGVRPLLHVIGEPANLSLVHLENWIKVHGLEGDVKITPTRLENLVDVMNRASLAVVSSLGSEVICRVAEEYLLCGVPLFVSGVGSLHEFFEDGMADSYRGLDTQGAAAALVASLKKALAEGSEARAVRASKARQSYSLETMGKRLKLILAERSLLTDLQN